MLTVLVAALPHDVPEEDPALRRIDQVVERESQRPRGSRGLTGTPFRACAHLNTLQTSAALPTPTSASSVRDGACGVGALRNMSVTIA